MGSFMTLGAIYTFVLPHQMANPTTTASVITKKILHIILLLMLTISLPVLFLVIFFEPPPWVNRHIIIRNDFESNQNPLITTCRVNNRNLGTQLLWNGKSFNFTYKNKNNVKFWCKMDYGKKTKNKLEILDKWGTFSHCKDWKKCYVSVRYDGFFVSPNLKKLLKISNRE